MNQRNVKWYQMTAEDTVVELNTNAACGLSCKAARSRSRKAGLNTLFDPPKQSFWGSVRPFVTDPSLLLSFFVSLFTLYFASPMAGLSALAGMGTGLLFSVLALRQEKRLERQTAKYQIPSVQVVRDRKIFTTSVRTLTVGDVILLKAGDLVPADCRLLSQDNLTVRTPHPNVNGKPTWSQDRKNADTVYPYRSEIFAPFYENMIYGGSVVLTGTARAVVTAIGVDTYLKSVSLLSATDPATTPGKDAFSPYLRLYSLALLALLLPLTVIGAFTVDSSHHVFELFLSLCAWVCTGSYPVLSFYFKYILNTTKAECFTPDTEGERTVIQSTNVISRAASVTDLFVMGRWGTSDGKPHLHRVALGNGEITLAASAPDGRLQSLCEAYWILSGQPDWREQRLKADPAWSDKFLKAELLHFSGMDVDALELKLEKSALLTNEEDSTLLDVNYRKDSFQLLFTKQYQQIYSCILYDDGEKVLGLGKEQKSQLHQWITALESEDGEPWIVIKIQNQRRILLGVFSLREHLQSKLPQILEDFHQQGVRLTFFFEKDTPKERRYARIAGIPQRILDPDPQSHRSSGDHRVFFGMPYDEITEELRICRQQGRRVAVLGNTPEDLPLLRRAHLSIACDPTPYHRYLREDIPSLGISADGCPNSDRCSQAIRNRTGVLIQRASGKVGGLAACQKLIAVCRSARLRQRLLLSALSGIHFALAVTVILSTCLGLGVLPALSTAFCGWILGWLLTYWILRLPVSPKLLRRCPALDTKAVEKRLCTQSSVLPLLIGGATLCIYAFVLKCLGRVSTQQICTFLLCSVLLLQFTAWATRAHREGVSLLNKKSIVPALSILLPVLGAVLLATLIPDLHTVLGLGQWHVATVTALPLSPLAYGITTKLFHFFKRTAK
ncbi:MAG: cation-transporting P-type ATPase [Clostridia bacterium]|nr:cation-transporting P-type ATPase [Clostridia bacterium]